MSDDDRLVTNELISGIVGIIIFVGSYIYCIATQGFFLGVGVGWFPAIIVAMAGYLLISYSRIYFAIVIASLSAAYIWL